MVFQNMRMGRKRVGVPAREIRALAREWAKNKTMLAAGGLGGWWCMSHPMVLTDPWNGSTCCYARVR